MNKFIDNYLTYTKSTETPELFHLWGALSCLAGAAERRLWLNRGMFNMYGNLYILLIAPPGIASKSTSIGYQMRIMKRCNYHTLDDQSTKEKIIDNAANAFQIHPIDEESKFPHTSMTYAMTELNTLLTAGTDMPLFLTRIFDEYDSYKTGTIGRGMKEIINPYFNLIAAATTEWFGKVMDSDLLSAGFLARCIVVYARTRRFRNAKPEFTEEQQRALEKCIEILNWIKPLFGEIQLTDEAEEFYANWYQNLPEESGEDPKLSGYFERKAKMFTLKVSMLLALGDKRKTVELKDMEDTLKIFDYTEPAMISCFALAGANKLAPYVRLIVNLLISNNGAISYADILRRLYCELDEEDIVKVIAIATNMGLLSHSGGVLKLSNEKEAKTFLKK